jgi:hypothetical protein
MGQVRVECVLERNGGGADRPEDHPEVTFASRSGRGGFAA